MAFLMRTMEEVYDYQNILLYGDFGVGKTYLAATAVLVPEMCDVLYIALEGGEKTLKEIKRICLEKDIDPSCIMVIPVTDYRTFAQVYEFLKLHVSFRDKNDLTNLRKLEAQVRGLTITDWNDDEEILKAVPTPRMFQTVIVDSLTEAQKYCMYQLLGINPDLQKIDAEPDSAEWKDWGRSREMIQFLIRRYRDLPMNSVFICGESIEQDMRKQFHYEPMLPGKLSDDVRGLVDTVGYLMNVPMEGGGVTRRLVLVGGQHWGAHFKAKHRYGSKLKAPYLDNITMVQLYQLGL